jgi:hypothetical protein
MGNMSFCGIARLLNVSDVAVLKWIRHAALKCRNPKCPPMLVMLDEMHHFLKKRQKSYGFGERLILSSGELYPRFWVSVMMQPVERTSTKSGWKAARS